MHAVDLSVVTYRPDPALLGRLLTDPEDQALLKTLKMDEDSQKGPLELPALSNTPETRRRAHSVPLANAKVHQPVQNQQVQNLRPPEW